LKAECVSQPPVNERCLFCVLYICTAYQILHERYSTTSLVLLCELLKLCVSFAMMVLSCGDALSIRELPSRLRLLLLSRGMLLISLPGMLYFVHNQLAFIALQRVDATTFAILTQLKFLTAAVFNRTLLGKKLYWYQHRALWLLVIGVCLVQTYSTVEPETIHATPEEEIDVGDAPTSSSSSSDTASTAASATGTASGPGMSMHAPSDAVDLSSLSLSDRTLGVVACLLIALISGFCGAYIEKMLKNSSFSVWERNVQLSLVGIVLAAVQLLASPSQEKMGEEGEGQGGLLGGFSGVTYALVVVYALGGIITSLILKHMDNVVWTNTYSS
jgi:UDP-sugar transporter A1/2/3